MLTCTWHTNYYSLINVSDCQQQVPFLPIKCLCWLKVLTSHLKWVSVAREEEKFHFCGFDDKSPSVRQKRTFHWIQSSCFNLVTCADLLFDSPCCIDGGGKEQISQLFYKHLHEVFDQTWSHVNMFFVFWTVFIWTWSPAWRCFCGLTSILGFIAQLIY